MISKKPYVSVIITSFNSANFLRQTINSVLKQTYNNFELIIVDDGSTDKSREIIIKFSNNDKRIRFHFMKKILELRLFQEISEPNFQRVNI